MAGVLKENGVHLPGDSLIKLKNHTTGTCVVLSGKTDRGFVSCMGANAAFVTSMFPRELIFRARHVHWAGYFNTPGLQSDEQVGLLRELGKRGISVSFDPQFDASAQWRGQNNNILAVLPLVDIFLPSEEELMGITATSDLSSAIKASSSLLKLGALLVVKCGEKGAKAVKNGVVVADCPAFRTTVVDTTGAGDAFNAGFLQQYVMEKSNIDQSLAFGCASGSLRVGLMSACDNAPSLAVVRERVARGRNLKASL